MTTDQLIGLSASIGAFASAVATFLTVREVARQRRDSYRPDLAFSGTVVDGTREGQNPLSVRWVSMLGSGGTPGHDFTIPLRNVGLGSAKQITLSWDFSIAALAPKVNEIAERVRVPVRLHYEDGFLRCVWDGKDQVISMWQNQRTKQLDYLLPASVQSEALSISIPQAYILVASTLIFVNQTSEGMSDWEIPSLKATLEFSDISSVQYQVCYELRLELMMISSNEFHASLQCRKTA